MDYFTPNPEPATSKPTPEDLQEDLNDIMLRFDNQLDKLKEAAQGVTDPAGRFGAISLGMLIALKTNPAFLVEFASAAAYRLLQEQEPIS